MWSSACAILVHELTQCVCPCRADGGDNGQNFNTQKCVTLTEIQQTSGLGSVLFPLRSLSARPQKWLC